MRPGLRPGLPDSAAARQTILLRNKCLQIVASVAERDAVSDPARLDEWMALLGYDWLLLFLQLGSGRWRGVVCDGDL